MKKSRKMLDVFEKYKYDPEIVNKSKNWYYRQATNLRKESITPTQVYEVLGSKKRAFTIGSMYTFFYDPKHKDTLPYYDVFPLIFPFEKTDDGFFGINFHYLPYRYRIILLDSLLDIKGIETISESTRMRLSWQVLKKVSTTNLVKPCVKRYLTSHLVTSPRVISAEDWTMALMLPVESFKKASAQKVWRESKKIAKVS